VVIFPIYACIGCSANQSAISTNQSRLYDSKVVDPRTITSPRYLSWSGSNIFICLSQFQEIEPTCCNFMDYVVL